MKGKEFYVVIERDEDGIYIGEVPQLLVCYNQGETIDSINSGKTLGNGLLLKILRDADLTKEQLIDLWGNGVTPVKVQKITDVDWLFFHSKSYFLEL